MPITAQINVEPRRAGDTLVCGIRFVGDAPFDLEAATWLAVLKSDPVSQSDTSVGVIRKSLNLAGGPGGISASNADKTVHVELTPADTSPQRGARQLALAAFTGGKRYTYAVFSLTFLTPEVVTTAV